MMKSARGLRYAITAGGDLHPALRIVACGDPVSIRKPDFFV